jgi:8-oxo-dGTP pyrophosphatase MutT (NUDIX family)
MNAGNSRRLRGSVQQDAGLARFHPSHIQKVRECQQVAAVCYRLGRRGIEFLLVQTRGGRWTFPKGGVEPGLTHAQTAALEAFEEAGVHGRMEEAAFTQYTRRPRGGKPSARDKGLRISAHLCLVLRLGPAQESHRNRTWFSPERTKSRLCHGRTSHDGAEFARVVEIAVARIQQAHVAPRPEIVVAAIPAPVVSSWSRDPLQHVRFEAAEVRIVHSQVTEASFLHYVRTENLETALSPDVREESELNLVGAPLLQAASSSNLPNRPLRRLTGTSVPAKAQVIAIDEARSGVNSGTTGRTGKKSRG